MAWKSILPRERSILPFGLAAGGAILASVGVAAWAIFSDHGAAAPSAGTGGLISFGVLVAAASLAISLGYRHLRGRVLAMAALREAVLASRSPSATADELALPEGGGELARAWNDLVRSRLPARGADGPEASAASPRDDASSPATQACAALWLGVIVADGQLRPVFANQAAAMLLGVEREALLGCSLGELLDLGPLFDNGVLRRATMEIERGPSPGGTLLRVSVRGTDQPDRSVVLVEDVTQQQAAEQARANFVAQATHELRTPLTNMRLYAETALGEDCDQAMLGTCLNVINQEVRRLERVVADMLSVSEMEAGALSIQEGEARLDQLFEELRGEFEPQAQAQGVALSFELPAKLPVVRGDRDKLLQACHNVLGNAIKYTPSGGSVTLVADWGESGLSIAVRDTGEGIDPGDTERIFDRFYRADKARASDTQGTGLGLTLAKEILLCHDGTIEVDSQPGKGSVFTLSLPPARLVA